MSEVVKEPKGLGGWLILFGIGLIVSPIRLMFFLLNEFLPIFTGGYWETLTTPGTEAYHSLWAPMLTFEIIGNLLSIAFCIILLIYYFTKSFRFPKLMIWYLIFNFIFVVSDFFLADLIPAVKALNDNESLIEVFRAIIGLVIWIPYLLKSKRVKNTFVKDNIIKEPIYPASQSNIVS